MTVYEYMQNNPWMTFFFILGGASTVKYTISGITIWLRGYPPEHVNAHGQWHKDDE